MATTDLDELKRKREAKAKASGKSPKVKFGGQVFNLPVELPFGLFMQLDKLSEDNDEEDPDKAMEAMEAMSGLVDDLLGDQRDAFLKAGPSLDDIMELLKAASDSYEVPKDAKE